MICYIGGCRKHSCLESSEKNGEKMVAVIFVILLRDTKATGAVPGAVY